MNRFQLEVAFRSLDRKDYDRTIVPIYDYVRQEDIDMKKETSRYYDKIEDNLYLGAYEARFDPKFGAIVTLVSPVEFRYISQTHPITLEHTDQVLVIPISDAGDDKIGPHIQSGIDFINKHIQDKNVLVHCMAGISRSSSMIIAYLMSKGMDMPKAYWHVRDRRNIINPYSGFIKEIVEHFREKEERKKLSQSC